MPHSDCDKVMAAIFAEPWAILPEALDQIVAIAGRVSSDPSLALARREERAERIEASRRQRTALIPVHGPIFPRAALFGATSGATNVAALNRMLDYALAEDEIGAIVLDIDSPGGQVTGIHELAERIRAAASVKPVVAYVSGMAASAAYWLASAAGRIVADPTTKVGSIGVVCAWTDDSAARKRAGLKDYVIVSTQSPAKYRDPNSPEGRSEIQEHADFLAEIFIAKVAEYRGVTADAVVRDFGQGSVLLAEAGLRAGMVDEMGSMESVLEELASGRIGLLSKSGGNFMAMTVTGAAGDGKGKPRTAKDEKDPKDKDEPETAEDTDETTDDEKPAKEKEKAKAEHSGIYETAFLDGVNSERARIREIRELGLVGHKELVERAMFDEPMTASEVAVACIKADSFARTALAKGRIDESATANVPVSTVDSGLETGNTAQEAAIIAAMAGKTSAAM